ncbi:MAG TPA: hypothetical protein VN875_17575 [Candidatus Binatus sp.]|nr:hypothetical protein [Candidatus Binatus sp.]
MSSKITPSKEMTAPAASKWSNAIRPSIQLPPVRRLRVFAFDPLLGTRLETLGINETTLEVRWEEGLEPGPAGEYIEVVDVDPASDCCYSPVDLNHPSILAQSGLSPSEALPQFHQQMVYGVAMKTIDHFEKALGRVALWAPRLVQKQNQFEDHYVRRLRIYPHALREANSYYSPDKKALLLGYFSASASDPGENLPGGMVFCSLSHDIIAHETTHALLDGLHRRFREATNPDVLAFHEAFADVVALFQHFTVPEALKHQIAKTQGDLAKQNMLGELAQQFGQATGMYGALRSAIGIVKEGRWEPVKPSPSDYQNAVEAHDRGAVLVAAIFDAFLSIYGTRSADLIRLATGGTGVLRPGAIPEDLVNRLALEASKTASHVLSICIRALDYCPPVDITFGEYLRALITADKDLVPEDKLGYRVAFIQAFRRRGIYPKCVKNLSVESLCWGNGEVHLPLGEILDEMSKSWDLHVNRSKAYGTSKHNAFLLHEWLKTSKKIKNEDTEAFGIYRSEDASLKVNGQTGNLSKFEVHSVRPVRRIGPDGQQLLDLVIEITQSWSPADQPTQKYRGGCTLIVNLETSTVRHCVMKRVGASDRVSDQQSFQTGLAAFSLRQNYFDSDASSREPFAMLHRGN